MEQIVLIPLYNFIMVQVLELAHTVPVPADSTLIVLGKDAPIYWKKDIQ